jgi:hypothetical protein
MVAGAVVLKKQFQLGLSMHLVRWRAHANAMHVRFDGDMQEGNGEKKGNLLGRQAAACMERKEVLLVTPVL